MLAGNLRDLRQPDAVIVDNVRLEKLYPYRKLGRSDPAGERVLSAVFEAPI